MYCNQIMLKQNLKIILILLIFLILPSLVFSAPNIIGVSGNVSEGQTITISGNSFGNSGPNIVLHDDFEKGTVDNSISILNNSANIGHWETLGGTEQTYSNENFVSGAKSMKIDWTESYGSGPGMSYSNVQNSDIFLSWWQYMPINANVPGTFGPEAGLPNWKWFWIGDQTDGWPWGSDYVTTCLSNENCDGIIGVFPADDLGNPEREGGTWFGTSFVKGVWIRVSVAMKNATSGGYIWNQELSSNGNFVKFDLTNIVTAHNDDPWNILTLPGFGREDPTAALYIDDVYLATGNAARARVEIGNASTYNSSTNLTLLAPTSWSSGEIEATVRKGSFSNSTNAYLYVTDSTGAVNVNGYPITIVSGSGDTTAPSVPQGLSVL